MTAKPAVDETRLSRVLFLLALSVFIHYLTAAISRCSTAAQE
jgi:hypothetical protein